MAKMLQDDECVTLDQFRAVGKLSSGCPPGVYVMYVHGLAKVGRSNDVYIRYMFYLSGMEPPSTSAKQVFLVGFLAALPGEDLKTMEAQLIQLCLEMDSRVEGREWFQDPGNCLDALSALSRQRVESNTEVMKRDSALLVAPTFVNDETHYATFLFPAYVSATCRRITYLVMAFDHETSTIVVQKTTIPYSPTWTILACYVQDPGAEVTLQQLQETLVPHTRCEKIASFLTLNAEESDIFYYTSPNFVSV